MITIKRNCFLFLLTAIFFSFLAADAAFASGSISGTVYQSGTTTPIVDGGFVDAYTGYPCSYPPIWAATANISATGEYSLTALPAGTYYLKANTYGEYLDAWWALPSSVYPCSQAQAIALNDGDTLTGKDF